jgi:hypothetical protein
MRRLIEDARADAMPFVVWWNDVDLIPQDVATSCPCEDESDWCNLFGLLPPNGPTLFRYFGTMGLRDHDGLPRPALSDWKDAIRVDAPPRRRAVRHGG